MPGGAAAKNGSFLELNIYLYYTDFPKPASITTMQDTKKTANPLFEISNF